MSVRATRVEVIVPKERRMALRELCIDCQRMTNRIWQIWLCHHANNGSAEQLRKHFEDYRIWQTEKRGPKPQWPCKALESPLITTNSPKSFYRILKAEFPQVNTRTRGLLLQAWQSRLSKRKASSGSLPGWVAILFALESLPSVVRPQPVPFDHDNAKLQLGSDGKTIELEMRLDRDPVTGKSSVDRVPLMLNKRKARNARTVADRVLSGVYAWKGSSLIYDNGKFYALLCYQMPQKATPELDTDKVMWVTCGRRTPLRYMVGFGGSRPFGGDGCLAASMRKRIEYERRSRQEHNRFGGSNRKGHGRRHACSIWTRLSSRWFDGVKRYNNDVTTRLVRMATDLGCGRIVYLQPTGAARESRLLSVAGAELWTRTKWNYFQIGTMLAWKCEDRGIEFGVDKKNKRKEPAKGGQSKGARKGTRKPKKTKAKK